MKVLIGYDGSECADAALLDLQRAGLYPTKSKQLYCRRRMSFFRPITSRKRIPPLRAARA